MKFFEKELEKKRQEHNMKIETYLRLRIKPKPKGIPMGVWKALLGKLLILERFDEIT